MVSVTVRRDSAAIAHHAPKKTPSAHATSAMPTPSSHVMPDDAARNSGAQVKILS